MKKLIFIIFRQKKLIVDSLVPFSETQQSWKFNQLLKNRWHFLNEVYFGCKNLTIKVRNQFVLLCNFRSLSDDHKKNSFPSQKFCIDHERTFEGWQTLNSSELQLTRGHFLISIKFKIVQLRVFYSIDDDNLVWFQLTCGTFLLQFTSRFS